MNVVCVSDCGYLCHETCRPGVGLDCPSELEKRLEADVSSVNSGDDDDSVGGSSIVSEHFETTTHSSHSIRSTRGPDSTATMETYSSEHTTERAVENGQSVDSSSDGDAGPHVSPQAREESSSEKQVQKWAKRIHRSNTLYSKVTSVNRSLNSFKIVSVAGC